MNNIEKVLEFLRNNPTATNPEIGKAVRIDADIVKAYISKLKARGNIEVQGQGVTRTITVLKELPVSKHSYKKDVMTELSDIFLEDIRNSVSISEKIELGKLIIKIIEKL